MLKKFFLNLRLFIHGVFYGLKSADDVISNEASYGSGDIEISQEHHIDSIYNDFIRGEETQRVKETRDEYYRTLREADQYHVDVKGNLGDESNGDLSAVARKKTALDFACKIDLYNPEKLPVRVIQDNKLIPKHNNMFADDLFTYGMDDFVSIFDIERDNFTPRFKIENYFNKLVVRTIDEKHSYIDLYTTMYASQFGKVDAILISQLNLIKETGNKKSDITTLKKVSFVTDKAYGENDLFKFSFENIVFEDINVFDGNFVLTFRCDNLENGIDLTEKYKTKELDEKLKNKSVRDNIKGVDIFVLKNKIDKEEEELNLTTTTLKIK